MTRLGASGGTKLMGSGSNGSNRGRCLAGDRVIREMSQITAPCVQLTKQDYKIPAAECRETSAAEPLPVFSTPEARFSLTTDAIEIIPGRLYWAETEALPPDSSSLHAFTIDNDLVYDPIFMDFGPLNLSMMWRYCRMMEVKMRDPALSRRRVVHCCSHDVAKRTNAAFLICAYQVVVNCKTAEEAFAPFHAANITFQPFRDASSGTCTFDLTIEDCLEGVETAIAQRLFDWNRFDADSYEYFSRIENGDMNWVIPGKFLAFAGPFPEPVDPHGFPAFTPEDYAPFFNDAGIRLVVRLNKQQYDKKRFIDRGIKHADLYFADGTCPPRDIISKFLHITESQRGPVAVHCKAGLGRTGTLIGLYAIKHFGFTARGFIGWSRICRPGSVLGPQQQFLVRMQEEMFAERLPRALPSGAQAQLAGDATQELKDRVERLSLHADDSFEEERREDCGQGERLCMAKRGQLGLRHKMSTGSSMDFDSDKARETTQTHATTARAASNDDPAIWSRDTSADSLKS